MLDKFLDQLKTEGPYLPNKFTIALGKLIQETRREVNMSQAEIANRAYLKQSSISKIENGTRAVSTEELLYISYALDKPIGYFFPKRFTIDPEESDLTILEKELLIQARQLGRDDLRRLIVQAKALAELGRKNSNNILDDFLG